MKRIDNSTKIAGPALATPVSDPRKGWPYVARLAFDPAAPGGFEREFVSAREFVARKTVRAVVDVNVLQIGDVLEAREAPSWKNDHRRYYEVQPEPEPSGPDSDMPDFELVRPGVILRQIDKTDAIRILKAKLAAAQS
ncbi:MAG: hypothetical protein QN174_07615 [Armatimonadota bacterium]|nr:hypothetical protein [Armatimonadota bacterium]